MSRTLVTGGAGLIGSHLVDELLLRGHDVRILDNLDPTSHRGRPPWLQRDAEFYEGDVRNLQDIERALRGVEDVYHLAAAVGSVTTDLSRFFDVNATGTARLFEAIQSSRVEVRRIVSPSSQAIYGEGLYRCDADGVIQPAARPLDRLRQGAWEPVCPLCGGELEPMLTDESARWHGETPYAVSKIAQERLLIGLGKRFGIPTVALRYAVVYGPRQSIFNSYTGILSIFSTLILNDRLARAFEDGRETRDFVFVTDVVAATITAMEADDVCWEAINVGRGVPVDIVSLIEALAEAYGREPDYLITGEFRPGDVRHLALDSRRLQSLGWQPETSLREGLAQLARWFQGLGSVDDYFTDTLVALREQGAVLQGGPTRAGPTKSSDPAPSHPRKQRIAPA